MQLLKLCKFAAPFSLTTCSAMGRFLSFLIEVPRRYPGRFPRSRSITRNDPAEPGGFRVTAAARDSNWYNKPSDH